MTKDFKISDIEKAMIVAVGEGPTSLNVKHMSIILRTMSEKDSITELPNGKMECSWGGTIWFKDKKVHRDNGPAIEFPDGSWTHYANGRASREDGPAHFCAITKSISWCLGGKTYSFDTWCKVLRLSNEDILKLRLRWAEYL